MTPVIVGFGVKLSRRLEHTDFVNVVLDACCAREKIVRDAAFEVLCELTKHGTSLCGSVVGRYWHYYQDTLRIKAVDADVLSIIRKNMDRDNLYALFSLANIAKDGTDVLICFNTNKTNRAPI